MKLCCLFLLLFHFTSCVATKITPASTLPDSTPWDLKELSAAPEFEWSKGDKIRSLYFKNLPYKGKTTRVFAYYATPGTLAGDSSLDKNLPAVVLVHGGGGQAFAKWAELWASRGYAAIAMDLAGCGPGKKKDPQGGPGQGHDMKFDTIKLPKTEQWSYHAAANVIKAHSLLLSFPEVDKSRTAITGISWGGYLTCIVTGLDNRFKASVPVYGCGFLDHNSVWMGIFNKMTKENRAKWVKLWDPSSYVGSAQVPMLFVNGGQDFAYPPDSYAKTYGLVKSEKNIRFTSTLRHGHIFDKPKAVEVFIDSKLKGGIPLPKISDVIKKDNVTAKLTSRTEIQSVVLSYTMDKLPGQNQKRKWLSKPAVLKDGKIISPLPPEGATIWFLNVTDERGATVSSNLYFK